MKNFFWIGKYPYKDLGIFAKESFKMTKNNWNADGLHNFLSVKIEDIFDLLGVWACQPYIEAYYDYQNRNLDKYNENTILIGVFNSNAQWDKKHGQKIKVM